MAFKKVAAKAPAPGKMAPKMPTQRTVVKKIKLTSITGRGNGTTRA